jgi:hypothetical protein
MPESIEGDDPNYQPSVRFWDSLIPKSKGLGGRVSPQKHKAEHKIRDATALRPIAVIVYM